MTVSDAVELALPIPERPVVDLSAPVFTKKMDDVTVEPGEEARFDARIRGLPEPNVEWYSGSKKIMDEGRFVHIDAVQEDLFTLIIENVMPSDSGPFRCVATNEAGETSCEAHLTVGVTTKPAGIEPEKSVLNVGEGDEVNLNVTFSGTTKPTVEWLKEGKPVRKNSRLDTRVKGDTYTLTITEAIPDDSATYSFKSISPAGVNIKVFEVNVQGKERTSTNDFDKQIEPKQKKHHKRWLLELWCH